MLETWAHEKAAFWVEREAGCEGEAGRPLYSGGYSSRYSSGYSRSCIGLSARVALACPFFYVLSYRLAAHICAVCRLPHS